MKLHWRTEHDAAGRYQIALHPDPRTGQSWQFKCFVEYNRAIKAWVLTIERREEGLISQTQHRYEKVAKNQAVEKISPIREEVGR